MENLQELLNTPYKEYIAVNEDRLEDGTIIPRVIIWATGERFEVDKVLRTYKAASTKAGGSGLCFDIVVEGNRKRIWLEDDCKGGGRYFVELRRPKPN